MSEADELCDRTVKEPQGIKISRGDQDFILLPQADWEALVEYGLKQSKNELGWADFRVTEYKKIEKWWELVMSTYLMVSLQSEALKKSSNSPDPLAQSAQEEIQKHPKWNKGKGWKNTLNNLRLFIQPLCYFNLLRSWLV